MIFQIEYTDTFGGEANYSWVRRETLEAANDISTPELKRIAKAAVGLSGARGTWLDYNDTLEFRPRRACTILFVTFQEG